MKNAIILKVATLAAYLLIFFTSHNISIPIFYALIEIVTNITNLLPLGDTISIAVLSGVIFWIISIFINRTKIDIVVLAIGFILMI
ncbi:MAG: hypothetical protein ACKO1F_09205, partial [Flammeovirgaceae bacterium]